MGTKTSWSEDCRSLVKAGRKLVSDDHQCGMSHIGAPTWHSNGEVTYITRWIHIQVIAYKPHHLTYHGVAVHGYPSRMETWTVDPKPIMVRSRRMRSNGPWAVLPHMDEWYVHMGGQAHWGKYVGKLTS